MTTAIIATSLGHLKLTVTDNAVTECLWTTEKISHELCESQNSLLHETDAQLQAYFSGQLKQFDLPLAPHGTDFQQSVWQQLQKIPYGKTCSYQDIAIAIHNQKAVRAVGMANGKNPICVIIPCHRVIYASQKIGGYSGGVHYKEKLLALENRFI